MKQALLCIGEVLWDALPPGLFLGGAPFNVACHLHALGEEGVVVSRVGDDVLGHEVLRRLEERGMTTDLVQRDPSLQTGFVKVALDGDGTPDYEIIEPVAWDALALTEELMGRAEDAAALVYGSLAQREAASRRTIQALCETEAFKVFDLNLRPPFAHCPIVEASLRTADVVKMNEDELRRISRWFDLPGVPREAMAALAARYGCRVVCVTQGGGGAALWREGRWWTHPGYRVRVEDTVGAGDAFLAALLAGLLDGRDGGELLDLANRLGAYVATVSGAVPDYGVAGLDGIRRLALEGREYLKERGKG